MYGVEELVYIYNDNEKVLKIFSFLPCFCRSIISLPSLCLHRFAFQVVSTMAIFLKTIYLLSIAGTFVLFPLCLFAKTPKYSWPYAISNSCSDVSKYWVSPKSTILFFVPANITPDRDLIIQWIERDRKEFKITGSYAQALVRSSGETEFPEQREERRQVREIIEKPWHRFLGSWYNIRSTVECLKPITSTALA